MPFVTAGDPDLKFTAAVLRELVGRGCHLCEVGIPYSDPIADGPVIQASYTRALAHKIKLADILNTLGDAAPEARRAARDDGQLRDRLPPRAGAICRRCPPARHRRADRARPAGRGIGRTGEDLPVARTQPDPARDAHHAARTGRADRRHVDRLSVLRVGRRHHGRADAAAAGAGRQRRLAPHANRPADLHRLRHQHAGAREAARAGRRRPHRRLGDRAADRRSRQAAARGSAQGRRRLRGGVAGGTER